MNQDTWSASQYIKFEQERNRPIIDLIAQIPTFEVNKAIDIPQIIYRCDTLGCEKY